MPFGPFILQWRAPSRNPPAPVPLPNGITRSYVSTQSGPLELLSAIPATTTSSSSRKPPLFFAHGGFGCASVWNDYMLFFSSRGYPCYALSYRGHGGSWYPSFWSMYFTTRGKVAEDLVAGIEEVERREAQRNKTEEKVRVVLIAHSAGGALSQWALGKGLVKVQGFCMFAAVPGFGSWSCYRFWALSAPLNYFYSLFHPRYLLVTAKQIHDAFFTRSTPTPVVTALERLLSPYESMLWPVQALTPIVTGPDVIQSITGWKPLDPMQGVAKKASVTPRLFVLAAEFDVLCTPPVLLDAARRYRAAFLDLVRSRKLDGVPEHIDCPEEDKSEQCSGVKFEIVRGVAHHLQNHVEWEKGAETVLDWLKELD